MWRAECVVIALHVGHTEIATYCGPKPSDFKTERAEFLKMFNCCKFLRTDKVVQIGERAQIETGDESYEFVLPLLEMQPETNRMVSLGDNTTVGPIHDVLVSAQHGRYGIGVTLSMDLLSAGALIVM